MRTRRTRLLPSSQAAVAGRRKPSPARLKLNPRSTDKKSKRSNNSLHLNKAAPKSSASGVSLPSSPTPSSQQTLDSFFDPKITGLVRANSTTAQESVENAASPQIRPATPLQQLAPRQRDNLPLTRTQHLTPNQEMDAAPPSPAELCALTADSLTLILERLDKLENLLNCILPHLASRPAISSPVSKLLDLSPLSILLIVPAAQEREWLSRGAAQRSLMALLKCTLSEAALKNLSFLPNRCGNKRILLEFVLSKVPSLILENPPILAKYGIYYQKVYQNKTITPLLPFPSPPLPSEKHFSPPSPD